MNRKATAALVLFLTVPCYAWDMSGIDLDKVASGGAKLYKAAAGLSDADEIKLGREVAANLAARYGLVDDPIRLKYVQFVGQGLVLSCRRPTLPYHFGILHSPEFNAFAAPGGYIFVTEGLLEQLHDEAELAGVLAHEITHVTERHVVKAIRDANLLGAGQDMAAAVSQHAEGWATLTDFSITLLDKGFSRKDELEADRLGTQLAAAVGYDARGLRDTVERQAASKAKDPIYDRFTSTHPPAADRLQAIEKNLKKSAAASAQPVRLAERYRQALLSAR